MSVASAKTSGVLYRDGGTESFSMTKLPTGVAGHSEHTETPGRKHVCSERKVSRDLFFFLLGVATS